MYGGALRVALLTSGGGGGGGASLPQPASVSIAAPARAHAAFLNVAKRRISVFSHVSSGGPDRDPRSGLRGASSVTYITRQQPRGGREGWGPQRSEEHTSELQSLMRSSYAGFC